MSPIRTISTSRYLNLTPNALGVQSSPNLIIVEGEEPALIINPNKFGKSYYSTSPVGKQLKEKGLVNAQLDMSDPSQLVFIQEYRTRDFYINPATGEKEMLLNPTAAKAWFKFREELNSKNIKFKITSAYRNYAHQNGLGKGSTVATPGSSPHGTGGALDFGNLYGIVEKFAPVSPKNPKKKLMGNPAANAMGRRSKEWQDIAQVGAKYGWYNPWRLSDNRGVDEIWHFEYWGPV